MQVSIKLFLLQPAEHLAHRANRPVKEEDERIGEPFTDIRSNQNTGGRFSAVNIVTNMVCTSLW